MTRYPLVKTCVLLSVLVVAVAPSMAQDEELVSIKRGTFEILTGPFDANQNELHIRGNKGFVMNGRVQIDLWPSVQECLFGACPPGAVVDLSLIRSGMDVAFDGKLRGVRFVTFGGISEDIAGRMAFSASITMPPMSEGPVTVTAPFEFAGLVSSSEGALPSRTLLLGGGIVTATLDPNPFETGSWVIQRIVFTFRPLAQR